jgi:hypothetical protein
MEKYARAKLSTIQPILLLVFLLACVALACSDSKPVTTQTKKTPASQTQKQADNPQIPVETHAVFSPLIGSGGTPVSAGTLPGVKITARPETLKVGEKVTITIQPGDIESPFYYLFVRDAGVADVTYTAGVSTANEVFPGVDTSQVLELVSATGDSGQAIFILQGMRDGVTELWASVIPGGSTTGDSVENEVSQSIQITVGK